MKENSGIKRRQSKNLSHTNLRPFTGWELSKSKGFSESVSFFSSPTLSQSMRSLENGAFGLSEVIAKQAMPEMKSFLTGY